MSKIREHIKTANSPVRLIFLMGCMLLMGKKGVFLALGEFVSLISLLLWKHDSPLCNCIVVRSPLDQLNQLIAAEVGGRGLFLCSPLMAGQSCMGHGDLLQRSPEEECWSGDI